MSMVKKWDIIIVVILMILSFTPEVILGIFATESTSEITYAKVVVDNEVIEEIPLTGHGELEEIEITTRYGTNILHVENEEVWVHSATCPDQVCLGQGHISKSGQMLVCLPNVLIVEVDGPSDKDDDTIISQ